MNKKILCLILLASMILAEPVESGDVSIMPDEPDMTPTPNNPPLLSITTDTQTVYVGELITVVFTVNVESSCNPSSGIACTASETLVPLSGANVQLQGAATGSGITNEQGQRTMTINAANAGTITATASKSGYTDGSVTINVESRPKPPPSLKITADTPNVNVGEPKSVTFTVTTENTCNPSSGQACPMATTDQNEILVSDVNVYLEGCAFGNGVTYNGNTVITVNANCAGSITVIASKSGYTDGKTTIEARQLATPIPTTPIPTTPIPTTPIPTTPIPTTPIPTQTLTQSVIKNFRVGPTVNLRPVKDDISKSEDGLIELYMDNPSLNDVMMYADVRISVPSGINVYGQGFGDTGSAGVLYAKFDIAPGKSRTIQITVKAEKTGEFLIKFGGLYWPGDNKDAFQPISLTHNFKVRDLTVPTTIMTPEIVHEYRFDIVKWFLDFLDKILGGTEIRA